MKKLPVFPTYRQELGEGRFRIIKIATFSRTKVSACCKEYKNELDDNPMIYHHSAKRTAKGETLSQLTQLAKDYYNNKKKKKINC